MLNSILGHASFDGTERDPAGAVHGLLLCHADFLKKFTPHVSSTLNPPQFPSDYLPKKDEASAEASTAVPEKLTLNFFLPHETTVNASKVCRLLFPSMSAKLPFAHVPLAGLQAPCGAPAPSLSSVAPNPMHHRPYPWPLCRSICSVSGG